MALKPEARAEWIMARLEGDEPLGEPAPAGASEIDLAELARDTADCRELWRELEGLNEGIASETASPGARSRFQARLAAAVANEKARTVSRSRPSGILGRLPRFAPAALAATALVAIATLTLWRPAPWSHRRLPSKGDAVGSANAALPSAASRLGAVLSQSGENDPARIGELGQALVSDPNPNVRLAALNALSERFATSGLEGRLAGALASESDPLVRLELIRTIGEHRLVRDGQVLQELALDPRLDDLARDEIARVMARLGS